MNASRAQMVEEQLSLLIQNLKEQNPRALQNLILYAVAQAEGSAIAPEISVIQKGFLLYLRLHIIQGNTDLYLWCKEYCAYLARNPSADIRDDQNFMPLTTAQVEILTWLGNLAVSNAPASVQD